MIKGNMLKRHSTRNIHTYLCSVFLMSVTFGMSLSAQLPKTDVYLAEFKVTDDVFQVSSVKMLNNFNPGGYNNQAQFFGQNEVYLTVGNDKSQTTDIKKLNIKSEVVSVVTETPKISEFSPTPYLDDDYFTVVRIEVDGVSQSLWMYPMDQSNMGKRLLPTLDKVGYHCWLSTDKCALFLVGEPHQLVIANVITGTQEWLANNIGRCLKKKNEELYYVEKLRLDYWLLKSYNLSSTAIKTICQMPIGVEDFDFYDKETIVVGDKDKLKTFQLNAKSGWKEVADFSALHISQINRIAIQKNRILFINNK